MGLTASTASTALQERLDPVIAPAGPSRGKVLAVDDDEAMLALLEETLREEGYEVVRARDTVTAFIDLLVEGADVVIVDWKMPELDGFELLGTVKRCFPTLPVIFITAHARSDVHDRAMQNGAFGFLAKPFSMADLLLQIEGALSPSARPTRSRGGKTERDTIS
ncbi:MAG TPA: response regulator [Candidatus Polarisedimenticolia bacterium]|nr:response regulator [Candidatus Polarisedimenticolia bacterium]